MSNFTAKLAVISLVGLVLGCATGEKKITLRFKFEPGMKLVYEQTTKSSYTVLEKDTVFEKGSRVYDVGIVAHVKSVAEDGTAELLDSTSWKWTQPNKEDSTVMDTVENIRATILFVEPDGRYQDIVFGDDEPASAAWIKNYYDQAMPVFPAGELPVGYSWTQTTKVLLPDETMNAKSTYRIKSFARQGGYDCAVIEYEGNLIIPIEPHEKDSVKYQGYDEIEITGVTYFAYTAGIILQERQSWMVDGHREKMLEDGSTETYKVQTKSELDYHLVDLVKP
ncbi:MAG: hypothetical protein ABIE70_13465 [bacterium]